MLRSQRRRNALLMLTLISLLFVTYGLPMPQSVGKPRASGVPYPCQTRPCGCFTSEQCWAGDCCCFTLEEKIAWAEANGVEPPEHARVLVASRKADVPKAGSSPKCCESESTDSTCPSCCSDHVPAARHGANCKPTPRSEVGVNWVIGIFAQKCRGEGPWGLMQQDPCLPAEIVPGVQPSLVVVEQFEVDCVRAIRVPAIPPAPPPRLT